MRRDEVRSVLGLNGEATNEKYVGLPIYIGKSKERAFQYFKDRIWQCIQSWQEKLLSKAGKEILIKAVAQAIPTYAMACFNLMKNFCDQVSTMICWYWWSHQDKNMMHWLSWDILKQPKMHCPNKVKMFAWRLAHNRLAMR